VRVTDPLELAIRELHGLNRIEQCLAIGGVDFDGIGRWQEATSGEDYDNRKGRSAADRPQ